VSGAGLAQVQWNQRNAAIEAPGLTLGHLPDPAADEERLCRHPESLTQIIAAAGASHQNSSVLTAFFGKEVEDSAKVDRLCVKRPVERIHVAGVEICIAPHGAFGRDFGAGMALATTTEVS